MIRTGEVLIHIMYLLIIWIVYKKRSPGDEQRLAQEIEIEIGKNH